MTSDNELWTKLEEQGEEAVGIGLAKGIYGQVGNNRQLVEQWLRMKAQSRADGALREQINIARDAADSARDAADEARRANIEARKANTNAKIAIAIAIGTMIVTIVGLVLSY